MSSSLPYMQFYVADYLADTMHLSTLEHGAYLLLLMNYWQRGGALPDEDVKLARIARLGLKDWLKVRGEIAPLFSEQDGSWFHKRVERELDLARAHIQQRSNAGKASAQRKRNERTNETATSVGTSVPTKRQRPLSSDAKTQRDDALHKHDAATQPSYSTEIVENVHHPDKSLNYNDTSPTAVEVSLNERAEIPESEQNREEKKSSLRSPKEKLGSRVPEDFWPNATCISKADELGILVNRVVVDSFLDYWRSVPGAKGRKLDWDATFRNHLDFLASKRNRNGNHNNIRDSIDEALRFRRWEESRSSGEGGEEDSPRLSGLRESPT